MSAKDNYLKAKLEKAKQALRDADLMINNNGYETAVNRIYYAVFHAVSALVYTKNLHPKTHTGLKTLFNREFILPGLIKYDYEKFYSAIFAKRMEADYEETFEISAGNAREYLKEAHDFVSLTENMLNNISEK